MSNFFLFSLAANGALAVGPPVQVALPLVINPVQPAANPPNPIPLVVAGDNVAAAVGGGAEVKEDDQQADEV